MNIRRTSLPCRLFGLIAAGFLLASSLLPGCGGANPHSRKPSAQVTVAVTYGGQPVSEGRVDLSNEQTGEGGGGQLNAQGVAVIPGVALGTYTVVVAPPELLVVPGATGQPAPANKDYPNIPKKVRSFTSSPLKVEVKKDSPNEFKFELKGP